MGEALLTIKPKPPYTITPHLRIFTLKNLPTPCIYDSRIKSCRRLVRWGVKELIAYEAEVVSEGWNPLIRVHVLKGDAGVVEDVVRHVLNVGFKYPRIKSLVKACPGLSWVLSKYPGLRPALNPSLWESLVKTVISQQVTMYLAIKLISRLTLRLGLKLIINGREFYDLPTPNEVLEAGADALRSLGLSRRKAEYLIGIAEAVVKQGYDLESIVKLSPEEGIEELRKFKGVGPWTAKLSYMAATGDLSIMLGEDLSVSRGLRTVKCREEVMSGLSDYLGLISYLASFTHESIK